MEPHLPVIWAAIIGTAVAMYVILDGFDLGVGLLLPFTETESRARPDDDLDRTVLGRQRDLAGARRRRAVGRLPAGLCGDHAGALSAGHRDAAGAGVSRSGVRIPRGLAQQDVLEPGIHARLARRRLLPGRDPWRTDPGHPGRGRRLCRRRLRLGHPLCAAMRPRRRRRVRPAGRHLARDEDRRRDRRRARAGMRSCSCWRCCCSWRR